MEAAEVKLKGHSHKEEGWLPKLFVGWPHWQPGCIGLQLITFYTELKVALHMNWRSQSFYSKDSKIVAKGLKPYLFLISCLLRTVNRFLERKYSSVIQRDCASSHLLWDHVEAARTPMYLADTERSGTQNSSIILVLVTTYLKFCSV